jgi:hypothetical protein
MTFFRLLALAALLIASGVALRADKPENKAAEPTKVLRSFDIPYKTTTPKHIVVRLKFNDKGPFNFILDTGAPALIVATKVGNKAGLKVNESGWATINKLEVEGGLVMNKITARVETPFQLEGMNGMGLAGLEVHGLMGYAALAKYRMEIDFSKDKMRWHELDYKPVAPMGLGGKGSGGQGGLEMFGTIMKSLGGFLGRKATPEVILSGFSGMTLKQGEEYPVVEAILEKGPAGMAGLKVGDLITKVQGRGVSSVSDVLARTRSLGAGSKIVFTVQRENKTVEIKFTASEGI